MAGGVIVGIGDQIPSNEYVSGLCETHLPCIYSDPFDNISHFISFLKGVKFCCLNVNKKSFGTKEIARENIWSLIEKHDHVQVKLNCGFILYLPLLVDIESQKQSVWLLSYSSFTRKLFLRVHECYH